MYLIVLCFILHQIAGSQVISYIFCWTKDTVLCTTSDEYLEHSQTSGSFYKKFDG